MTGLIQQVDIERIYKHVLRLEGPRHPLENMDALNEAADYLFHELENYGLEVEFQEFKINGYSETFKNVLAYIGNRNEPAMLIGSHYDSVPNCPGANDNLSAVAVSLEIARIMSQLETPPPLIIAIFSLEEGNPMRDKEEWDLGQKYGIFDNQGRYKSAQMHHYQRNFKRMSVAYHGVRSDEAYVKNYIDKFGHTMSTNDLQYFQELFTIRAQYDPMKLFEEQILQGSNYFVNNLDSFPQSIKGVINYDCIGWIRGEEQTHRKMPIPPTLMKTFKVDVDHAIGNFIIILGDKNSHSLLNTFLEQCRSKEINIPYVGVDVPLGYTEILYQLPDGLRMDHAPFWRVGIPAIALSDGANFRSELYHSPADTSWAINFQSLAKIAKATIETLKELQKI